MFVNTDLLVSCFVTQLEYCNWIMFTYKYYVGAITQVEIVRIMKIKMKFSVLLTVFQYFAHRLT